MDAKSILNTKVWLTIIGVMHLLMGVIVNYMENGSEDNLAGFGFFAMISFYLLYVAFMTTGQVQARLAVIFCGPVAVGNGSLTGVPESDLSWLERTRNRGRR